MAREPVKKFKAIVAAARRVNVDSAESIKATISKRQNWQEEFWAYYDEMPEVKYALMFLSNGMQKVRFFAATKDADGNVVPINSEGSPLAGTELAIAAEAEMNRISLGLSGQGEINRLLTLNLEGPGECHLHGLSEIADVGVKGFEGYVAGRPESWDVRSVSEIEFSDRTEIDPVTGVSRPKIIIKSSPDDKGRDYDPHTETLIRFWTRHPRFTEWADSHARSVMSDCEMLTLLAGEAKAISKSRHTAGAFALPSELSFVDDTNDGDEPQEGAEETNPFIDAFMKHQLDPVTDPSSPSSVQRLVISGPAEFLKPDVLRAIDLSRPADDKLTEKMDRHINRLARGLNVPVEVVMGHMSTTFSNAEQIDQDTFDDHFDPRCISIADGYAFGFLRPQLLGEFEPEEVMQVLVGYDPSALVADESLDQKADTLLEHGAISLEAYRRFRGVNESDAPTERERLRSLAERKGILTGELVLALFKASGVDLGITVEAGKISEGDAPSEPVAEEPGDEAVTAAGRVNYGRELAAIDRKLRDRLSGAVDMSMSRALERAGNKLKTAGSGSLRASLRSIPPKLCAAHLGPSLIADAGLTPDDLLANAWDDLGQQFKAWSNEAGDNAVDVINKMQRQGLSAKEIKALKVKQVADVDEAWQWFESSLDDVAKRALFAPDAGIVDQIADGVGEIDTLSHVQPSMLREALIRAGGGTGFQSKNGAVTPTNKVPLGGVATGERMMAEVVARGGAVEKFEWVYGGAARRSFEPHRRLAGKTFWNFDDVVLRNTTDSWIGSSHFYPGDHRGCVCDFVPVIVPLTEISQNAGPSIARQDEFLSGRNASAALTNADTIYDASTISSVRDYASAGAVEINGALRTMDIGDMPAEYTKIIRDLDGAMSPLKAAVRVERGLPKAEWMKHVDEGDVLTDAAFLSTSTDTARAAEFAHGYRSGSAVMRIDAPKGSRALWMNNVDDINATEQELLFARDTKLEVTSVVKEKRTIGGTNPVTFEVTVINAKVV